MNIILQVFQIIIGIILVLFLPGFVLSFVFFRPGKIDGVERLALSVALSLAVVPLVAFYANLAGIPITKVSVTLEVLAVTAVAGLIIRTRQKRK